jgi:ATP-binding cassette, subfamily B, bacterial HlyB/CyaB
MPGAPGSESSPDTRQMPDQRQMIESCLLAIMAAARFHGIELDRDELRITKGETLQPAALVEWARAGGLWARAVQLNWKRLVRVTSSGPLVLLLKDGSAALMVRADAARNVVWLRDPAASTDEDGVAVDEMRLSQVWDGATVMVRPERGTAFDTEKFSFAWIGRLVWIEKKILRDIFVASLAHSILAIVPAFIVMLIVDRVITYQSYSTLTMVALILAVTTIFDMLLGFVRRQLMAVVGARLDTKLSLFVFKRLLSLPIDYFERNQAGSIMFQLGQVSKIRDFMTGKLLTTILDLVTLMIMLPVLFYISVTMTWMVIFLGALLAMVILLSLGPLRAVYMKYQAAEIAKSTVMIESVVGIRTVKSLALEPQQREVWDRRTAEAAGWKQKLTDTANWPATISTPIDSMITRGVIIVGVYLALSDASISTGVLMAFMMLSGRVSAPLTGIARLMEDIEEVRAGVVMVANVLNNRVETAAPGAGLRPRFEGGISFENVEFSYPGTKARALDKVTFTVPADTTLGLVGRSGSGKSTVTRLLQAINREYDGYIRLDGNDLRAINLAHLRRSFGVVLQDNFLFRGTIKDNIIAGRPGLTLTDAVRAARLAGADEFIERMPGGYDTWIEEGSPNLSGGQRQRLAIARALIHDPRILILDEATSALDPESEALVNANIARIAHGRTMVIVSHRLSSLTECDNILVLDKGKMIDMGPHRDLVERCSIYRQLWLQQIRFMDAGKPPAPTPALAQGD